MIFRFSVSLKQQMANKELDQENGSFTKEELQSCHLCLKGIKLWKWRQMGLFSTQSLKMTVTQTRLKKQFWMER